MTTEFKYSLLKYVHSDVLSEEVTLGVLFLFPKKEKAIFAHPKSLKRIKGFYREFHEWQIKSYLTAFEHKANSLSKQLNQYLENGDIDRLIQTEFLQRDSTALRFSTFFDVSEIRNIEIEHIVHQYSQIYLSEYFVPDETHAKRNESYISKKVKNLFIKKKPDIISRLGDGYELKTHDKKATIQIDFWWQNGVSHLVKPVSFDQTDSNYIKEKAILNQGILNYFGQYAAEKNIAFDLLISAPQDNKNELREAYLKAIDILRDTNAPINIYEESDLDFYTEKAVEEIENHHSDK